MMWMTEVVQAANDIHTSFQGLTFASQGASAADKAIEALTKSGIETFDVGGIDDARDALSGLAQARDGFDAALDNTVVHVQNAIKALFDHLHDSNIGPR